MWLWRDEESREWARWAREDSWEWQARGRQCTHLSHLIAQSRARWYDLPFQIPCIIRIWNKGSYFSGYCHVTITLYCWQYTQTSDRSEIETKCSLEILKGREYSEYLSVGGRTAWQWSLGKYAFMLGIECRIGKNGGLLWTRKWNFEQYKKYKSFFTIWETVSFSRRVLIHWFCQHVHYFDETESLGNAASPLLCVNMQHGWDNCWLQKRCLKKCCSSDTMSSIYPTWTVLGIIWFKKKTRPSKYTYVILTHSYMFRRSTAFIRELN